jgi:hypothetical protein
VVDAANIERRGVPSVAVGGEALIKSVGLGAAKAQGMPELRRVSVPSEVIGGTDAAQDVDSMHRWADALLPGVIAGLTS